ncbi:MAG TPA: hypothetical protein VJ803_05965 [Gemmatimonadaceae bacterium]|nr:hypothetical protein [Gemmatimonadaceae bacterium]
MEHGAGLPDSRVGTYLPAMHTPASDGGHPAAAPIRHDPTPG